MVGGLLTPYSRRGLLAGAASLSVAPYVVAALPASPHRRAFEIRDLFKLESLEGTDWTQAFSKDGREMIIVRVRAAECESPRTQTSIEGLNPRSDVWIMSADGRSTQNLTYGANDQSTWFFPLISPSGTALAMISSRGGALGFWMWRSQDGPPKSLDIGEPYLPIGTMLPFWWLDEDTLLCAVRRNDEIAHAPVTVLESSPSGTPSHWPACDLKIVSLTRQSVHVIASKVNSPYWLVDPSARFLAVPRKVNVRLAPDETLEPEMPGDFSLEVVELDGERHFEVDAGSRISLRSVRWSSSGDALWYVRLAKGGGAFTVHRYDCLTQASSSASITEASSRTLDYDSFQVSENGSYLFRAAKDADSNAIWWSVASDLSLTSLASGQPTESMLLQEQGRSTLLTLQKGSLWRIDQRDNMDIELGNYGLGPIREIVWPKLSRSDRIAMSRAQTIVDSKIIVRDGNGTLFMIVLDSASVHKVSKPRAGAGLIAFSPAANSAVFEKDDDAGIEIWNQRVLGSRRAVKSLHLNRQISEIQPAGMRGFFYLAKSGKELKGWLLLPPNFSDNVKYPMVAWVYAGHELKDGPVPLMYSINSAFSLNLQILAARGFVVLVPSIPLESPMHSADLVTEIMGSVMPAVDVALSFGFVDENRLYVQGQSFGGFTTLILIGETNRFKAAVSSAAPTDFVSSYGSFNPSVRSTDYAHEDLTIPMLIELGQPYFRNSPWDDWREYHINSPINSVGRVSTPVMLIQGDEDGVVVAQGEEYFRFLQRQGKRAALVRYRGEGHIITRPANVSDMWGKIFGWYREFGSLV